MKRILLWLAIAGSSLIFFTKTARALENAWINIGPTDYMSSIVTTPWGILAGEHDARGVTNSYNGVFFSKNLGNSWQQAGLAGRRVTDVFYDNGKLYAATRQAISGKLGLFISSDRANTWVHQEGVNFAVLTVAAKDNTIVVGGISRGLWVSFNGGETWQQKIGDGTFGPTIDEVKLGDTVFFAAGANKVYKSLDFGQTWQEIPFFTTLGIYITYLEVNNNIVLAGAPNSYGLFRSNDYGLTWNNVQGWGSYPVWSILHFNKTFYAGKTLPVGDFGIFKSVDNGLTWEDVGFRTNGRIYALAAAKAGSDHMFAVTQYQGIFRGVVTEWVFPLDQFLNIPFAVAEQNIDKIFDKISAVFDHTYPLLGYGFHTEFAEERGTTTDFYGSRLAPPQLYYSSHNGVDFALPLGTVITAPANGYATYYYCADCGHTIKINHQNGYQTTYMHLQNDGLITKSLIPALVNAGDAIGKVGMTGRTSGPHLHFLALKDANANGTFADDFPHGLVDPFGWQNNSYDDPWELYSWVDALGVHVGTRSMYLWNSLSEGIVSHIDEVGGVVEHENKKVYFPVGVLDYGFGLKLQNYIAPVMEQTQKNLSYIFGTSTLINAYNYLGESISNFNAPVQIEIDFSGADLTNTDLETIKIYKFNTGPNFWEPLVTTFLDMPNKIIMAETLGFSHFAVFGEKIDSLAPVTTITIEGEKVDGWYIQFPTISFTASDLPEGNVGGSVKTYYLIGGDIDWQEYTAPFVLERDGVFGIELKSVDSAQNWEEAQDVLLKVNVGNNSVHTNIIFSSSFEVAF